MGLICPKCGVDNLLTAIFCRGCGEKLDLNEMKPEALLNDKHSKAKRKGASPAQKTFVGVFFGLLGIMVLLAMCPVGAKGTEEAEIDKKIEEVFALVNKAKSAPKPSSGKKPKPGAKRPGKGAKVSKLPSLTIDSDTASKLISGAMGMPKQDWQGALVPQHFSVDFKADNNIKIVVKTKAFGVLPLACSANAKIEAAEEQGAKFQYTLESPKLGALPLLVYGDLSTGLIQSLMDSVPVFQTLRTATELTTTEGSLTAKF